MLSYVKVKHDEKLSDSQRSDELAAAESKMDGIKANIKPQTDEIETIKNKYNIKYYIIGGGIQIPGLNLLSNSNVKVDLPKKMIMNLRVDPAYNVSESKQMHIVFSKKWK